ncbi:hypothetical protein L202_05900 [Cryptococcus amylolentus CBS 6039]|uniref:FHA domain-containing protein n=1 Tax=Cryptococcus amylolentus CBS 6039 TaxID=1295533 RepID=A0A1E3HIF3_9TREE|nr:hypothetical protein L202_05900 [Cryptococcus amylolentus CBS 6039]ODN75915.1 hypothetical protein L202_05900 [Cryptococcus amylolentus CBS 6039]
MQEHDGREDSPMPLGPQLPILGTLSLLARNTGDVLQTFPIDVERITIGRDADCDLRLYYQDVSKIHAELVFDLTSGQASIHAKGSNGFKFHPHNGDTSTYKPPCVVHLNDNDTIIIRNKRFLFNYGNAFAQEEVPMSPAVRAATPARSGTSASPAKIPPITFSPARKRSSYRMSLVPAGTNFVPFALSPAKNRRHSTLGLGGLGEGAGGSKSKLAQEMHAEAEEEAEDALLAVTEGDGGDKIYIEAAEDEEDEEETLSSAIQTNPFMTPQPKGKAPMRKTSAVPRTRTLTDQAAGNKPLDISTPPPSSPHRSPRKLPVTPVPVPAHVALSTPKGPATLRKALLLRSARKVWHETHATGIDGAMQDGHIEIRRKSTSPRDGSRRKSSSPKDAPPPPDSSSDEDVDMVESEEAAGDPEPEGDGQLRIVFEDGQADISFDSDSSGLESADISLDIPGQGVIRLDDLENELEEEFINEPDADAEDSVAQTEGNELHGQESFEEYDSPIREELEAAEDQHDEHNELPEEDFDEEDDLATSSPGTPQARSIATNKFFTPQIKHSSGFGQMRRSLGPPMRVPVTPDSYRPFNGGRTPGSLGKPSRRLDLGAPKQEVEEVEQEREVKPQPAITPVKSTPRKSAAAIAKAKRLHEALATPRTLPPMPASGFKNPVREIKLTHLTPSHPALSHHTPEPESDLEEEQEAPVHSQPQQKRDVPGTPLIDIKKRLDSMRRQSVQRSGAKPANRRATVGFALPSTPSQKASGSDQLGYLSVARNRTMDQAPRTPIFPLLNRELVAEQATSPDDMQEDEKDESPTPATQSQTVTSPTPNQSVGQQAGPSTPSFAGLRQMMKTPQAAKTPHLSGIRHLYPPLPQRTASPSLTGVKSLLAEPKEVQTPDFTGVKVMLAESKVPQTPSLVGVKRMFGEMKVSETPNMEGLNEMYEEEVEEALGEANSSTEETGVDVEMADKVKEEENGVRVAGKAATKLPRLADSTSARTRRVAPAVEAVEESSSKPSRTTTRKATAAPQPKFKPSRATRKADPEAAAVTATEPEPTSRSTRSRRGASHEPTGSGMSRATRAQSTAEPEDHPVADDVPPVPALPAAKGRSVSARSTRKASAEIEDIIEEKPSKATRAKKVLSQIEEQPVVEEKKSAPTRAKRAAATAPSATTTGRRTVSAPTRSKASDSAEAPAEKLSAPVRRTKAKITEKENDETLAEGKDEKPVVKRRAATAGASGLPVPSGRVTRSRK